jgi:hypothetical protein
MKSARPLAGEREGEKILGIQISRPPALIFLRKGGALYRPSASLVRRACNVLPGAGLVHAI